MYDMFFIPKLPCVSFRDDSYLPPTKASQVVKNNKKKKSKDLQIVNYTISEPLLSLTQMETPSTSHSGKELVNDQNKHCICECPELDNIDVDDWLELYTKKILDDKADKPFKTGKEPMNLISKRDFKKSPKEKLSNKRSKGIISGPR